MLGFVRVLALLGALLLPVVGQAAPVAESIPPARTLVVPVEIDKIELWTYCAALALYYEGGSTGESTEGLVKIKKVIATRALANEWKWGGADVCDVVFFAYKGVCQFSFACDPKNRKHPPNNEYWRAAYDVADKENMGDVTAEEARYYLNPSLTSCKMRRRFEQSYVFDEEVGRHKFYRPAERGEARAPAPPECPKPVLAKLKAKAKAKLLAKLKAKKRNYAKNRHASR
jgi:hypothetical protein